MGITGKDETGLPVGRCDECGDVQELHECPRCDLAKCSYCYGDRIGDVTDAWCEDCVEEYEI